MNRFFAAIITAIICSSTALGANAPRLFPDGITVGPTGSATTNLIVNGIANITKGFKGSNDGTAPCTGCVNQYFEAAIPATSIPAGLYTAVNLTSSVTLDAGTWILYQSAGVRDALTLGIMYYAIYGTTNAQAGHSCRIPAQGATGANDNVFVGCAPTVITIASGVTRVVDRINFYNYDGSARVVSSRLLFVRMH